MLTKPHGGGAVKDSRFIRGVFFFSDPEQDILRKYWFVRVVFLYVVLVSLPLIVVSFPLSFNSFTFVQKI